DNPTPLEQEKRIERIIERTKISNPRANLVEIAYTDSSAQRAYEVTRRFAELVIVESLATMERESIEAYNFIEAQAQE
ncbi:hypothetical protein, partial [Salmonella enterica]|uniref:hypothetical protein n=1 Tax=Salmonella enterica TaxID=28901 RepID=UPI00329857C8